jgi:hypothetical protein
MDDDEIDQGIRDRLGSDDKATQYAAALEAIDVLLNRVESLEEEAEASRRAIQALQANRTGRSLIG